ncbi:MAG TPA: DUF2281 domain-containing protein [Pirellulales bacterium]|nr:DUF2281 domain-containing protein [Pirellulales bacterium]
MLTTVSLEDAQAQLPELIEKLLPGDDVVILRGGEPVARLVSDAPAPRKPRLPGSARDKIVFMAEDFDAPLDDFREYME